jgi:hypothetical protein
MLANVAPQMARHWIGLTTGNPMRLGALPETVCPACDSYAIGAEMTIGLPFYSDAIAAFATVHDWDWSNRDPAECDIRDWPDFGCLTFSEHALRGAVDYLREADAGSLASATPLPFDPNLVGPTGIPEDEHAEAEWTNQLGILQARMQGDYSARELELAVRTLISAIAPGRQ